MEKQKSKTIISIVIIGFIIGIALILFAFYQTSVNKKSEQSHISEKTFHQYIKQHNIKTIGDENADLKLVVFQDLQCKDCKNFYNNIIKQKLNDKIDNGYVSLTYIPYNVVNDTSYKMSHMAKIIQNNNSTLEYEAFINEALNHQNIKDPKQIVKHIDTISNSKELFKKYDNVKDSKPSQKELKEKFNLNGTPTVYLNGELIKNYNDTNNIIEKKLKE